MDTALTKRRNDLVLAGPGGSLDSYLQAVYSIPVLGADEERALAIRYHDEEDLDAARELILSHLRFVVHIARGYMGYGLPLGDLIQEGNVGLMKAVKRFDPGVGVRLVSFAVHWIRAEIHEFILRNWRIVKVATTKAQRKLFFNLRSSKKRLGWFSREEVEAVAEDLGVSSADVLEMESRLAAQDPAFDPQPDDGEAVYSPAAYLGDDSEDPAVALEESDWEQNNSRRLQAAMAELDDRSRDIMMRRWMAESKTTLSDLAEEYGISAERVRQLESNAIKKMRQAMTADGGNLPHLTA